MNIILIYLLQDECDGGGGLPAAGGNLAGNNLTVMMNNGKAIDASGSVTINSGRICGGEGENIVAGGAVDFQNIMSACGDLNNNGTLDLYDVITGLQILAGMPVQMDISQQFDVFDDGKFDLRELLFILQLASYSI